MPEYKPVLNLDVTGISPDNLVLQEEHILHSGDRKLVVPKYGSFFKEGLSIYTDTGTKLTDDQYMIMELYQDASLRTGKAVFNVIVLTDPNINNKVKLDYQALGGDYCVHNEQLLAWFNTFKRDDLGADWSEITDKPKYFTPAKHKQHIRDLYGAEYIVEALMRVRDAIELQALDYHANAVKVLEEHLDKLKDEVDTLVDNNLTIRIIDEMPPVTKEYIGLGLVENYPPMTVPEAKLIAKTETGHGDLDFTEKYLTLSTLKVFISRIKELYVSKTNTHIGDKEVTYKDPSRAAFLSAVSGEIFILPSKLKAKENNLEYEDGIYPIDLTETEELAIMKISNTDASYGGVWLGVGLESNRFYLGILPNDMCFTKSFWAKFLITGELKELDDLVETHIKDTKNPHKVNKEQIGLGLVENLPVVTVDDMATEKGVYKYVTLDTLQFYALKWLTNAKAPLGEDGKPDPNRRLMDQDQIIFTNCKKCVPEDCPSKGQLVRTWCDGTERFARYTDGACGFYDEVLQTNSDDCKYYDMPKDGTVMATYCDDTTKMSSIADGRGGEYKVPVEYNSEDCGYVAPQPAGTVIATYCKQNDKITRIADGAGNTFEVVTAIDSEDCGFIKPPAAGTILKTYCQGNNEYRVYADGYGGEKEGLYSVNSTKCNNNEFNEGAADVNVNQNVNVSGGGGSSGSSSGFSTNGVTISHDLLRSDGSSVNGGTISSADPIRTWKLSATNNGSSPIDVRFGYYIDGSQATVPDGSQGDPSAPDYDYNASTKIRTRTLQEVRTIQPGENTENSDRPLSHNNSVIYTDYARGKHSVYVFLTDVNGNKIAQSNTISFTVADSGSSGGDFDGGDFGPGGGGSFGPGGGTSSGSSGSSGGPSWGGSSGGSSSSTSGPQVTIEANVNNKGRWSYAYSEGATIDVYKGSLGYNWIVRVIGLSAGSNTDVEIVATSAPAGISVPRVLNTFTGTAVKDNLNIIYGWPLASSPSTDRLFVAYATSGGSGLYKAVIDPTQTRPYEGAGEYAGRYTIHARLKNNPSVKSVNININLHNTTIDGDSGSSGGGISGGGSSSGGSTGGGSGSGTGGGYNTGPLGGLTSISTSLSSPQRNTEVRTSQNITLYVTNIFKGSGSLDAILGVSITPDSSAPVKDNRPDVVLARKTITAADSVTNSPSSTPIFMTGTRGWHAVRTWIKNSAGTLLAQSEPVGFNVVGD